MQIMILSYHLRFCAQNGIAIARNNFTLSYDTNIPRQVGLAGMYMVLFDPRVSMKNRHIRFIGYCNLNSKMSYEVFQCHQFRHSQGIMIIN